MIPINTDGYSRLEIFAESDDGKDGFIELQRAEKTVVAELSGKGYYRFIQLPVEKNTDYQLICHDCHISVGYLSGHTDLLEIGVRFLEGGKLLSETEFSEYYDTPYREQYHFNPFKNWINDPNGLCRYQGRYHMFYQANPHGQEWSDMYWGHAVSGDLMHWKHLPFVLSPQHELLGNEGRKGGAFSGSAVPLEDEVVFYLTRHDGPQEDGPDTVEWQTMTRSRDMLNFEPEKEIIRQKPEGAGHDFRDPKVTRIGDFWYMVLGSNIDGVSAILLYRSADMESWDYIGPLLKESDPGATTIECPDFFPLDNTFVALAALMRHVDEYGRYQMTRCYIGDFKEGRLEVRHTQWFDFGSNFYAVQSFCHDGRRIAIGWISDFYQEHQVVVPGACGSMSLPRELHICGGRLYMTPAAEVYGLLGEKLYDGCSAVSLPEIKGNSFYVKAEFSGDTGFCFLLGEDGDRSIWLKREQGKTFLKTVGTGSSHVEFRADVEKVSTVEIFVDRRCVEVFLNRGEAAGTKIFYTSSKNGVFSSKVDQTNELCRIEIYSMKSVWQ